MSSSQWLELLGLVLGGGGGTQLITKLTRMAVAVEKLVESHQAMLETVADHEKRLGKGGL